MYNSIEHGPEIGDRDRIWGWNKARVAKVKLRSERLTMARMNLES